MPTNKKCISTRCLRLCMVIMAWCILLSSARSQSQILGFPFEKLRIQGEANYAGAFSVAMDPFGFLWIGTNNGLLKYEGNRLNAQYHIIGDPISLPANSIDDIHSDRQGNIYIKCSGHPLYMLFRKNGKFYQVKETLDGEEVLFKSIGPVIADTSNIAWIGTPTGICSCELSESADSLVFNITCDWPDGHPLKQFAGKRISNLMYSQDNKIWVSAAGSLYRFDPDQLMDFDTLLYGGSTIRDLFQSVDGQEYVLKLGEHSVLKWNSVADSFDIVPGFKPLSKISYRFGACDNDQNIWISELGYGMHVIIAQDEYEHLSTDQTTSALTDAKYIRKPVTDHAGNIWWPAVFVYKTTATNKKVRLFQENFRGSQYVSAVLRQQDILWIGTLGGGLLKYDLRANTYEQLDKNVDDLSALPDERVYLIKPFGQDSLLLLTRGYLVIYNKKTGHFKRFYISSGPVRSAVFDRNGAYISVSRRGIYYLDFNTGKKELLLDGSKGSDVVAQTNYIYKSDDGILWFCTLGGGLVKYSPATGAITRFIHDPENNESISSNTVNMLATDHTGQFWLATNEGLNIFDPTTEIFESISSDEGLSSDYIQNATSDKHGNIWVTAGSAMHVINVTTREVRTFNYGEGLTNSVYYPRSIYIDDEGQVFIGGREGLNFFNPDEMGVNNIPPQVWFTGIERSVDIDYADAIENVRSIILTPSEEYVRFSFATTHFTNPAGNRFEYRLLGLDDHWVNLGGENTLSLAGLQAGDYTLEIRCFTSEGIKSKVPASLAIEVQPHFYDTWWFLLLMMSVFVLVIFFLARYRMRQSKKEAMFKQRLAETEMKALRSQMNPHFIFNSLNSIKSYIAENNPRTASAYLTKFARLMRHILNHSKVEQVSLKEEMEALELYIQLEQIRFSNQFTYEIEVDPELNIESVAIQPLLIQPFVENAIWHGLMHVSHPGLLHITITSKGRQLSIEIEDNGVGRQKADQIKQHAAEKTKSHGMQITLDRLKSKYGDDYDLKIIDKQDAQGMPDGTIVKLKIPKNTTQ